MASTAIRIIYPLLDADQRSEINKPTPIESEAPAESTPAVEVPDQGDDTPEPQPEPEQPDNGSDGSYTPPSGLGGNGKDHWAITYTPYTEDASGSCKSRDEVFADIKKIKGLGFNTVRVYATDCDTLPNVGDACEEEGLQMIIGVFVDEPGCGFTGSPKKQVDELVAWGKWDMVPLCVIGNEAIFSGTCDAGQLKSLIDAAKEALRAGGYEGPVTTAETVANWQEHGSTWCDSVDIAGANTHPYFDPNTSAGDAGPFVKSQLEIVQGICNKRAISLECGWPTQGNCNGKACAGVAEQAEAIESVRGECGADVVFFTYGEAHWKGDSECGCEPYFDVAGVF